MFTLLSPPGAPDIITPPSVEPTAPKSPPLVQRAPLEEKEASKNLDSRDSISENGMCVCVCVCVGGGGGGGGGGGATAEF